MVRPGVYATGGSGGTTSLYGTNGVSLGGSYEPAYTQQFLKYLPCECGYKNQFNDTDSCVYCGEKFKVEELKYEYTVGRTGQSFYTLGSASPVYVETEIITPTIRMTGIDAVYGMDSWAQVRAEADKFGLEIREFVTKSGRTKKETWHCGQLLHSEESA